MTHYKTDWSTYPTDAALDRVNSIAGTTLSRDLLRPVVATICRAAGGLPVTDAPHDDALRTATTLRLLAEASARLVSRSGQAPSTGYVREALAPGGPLAHELLPVERFDVNVATEADLEALPEIGTGLARRIIRERQNGGAFATLEELADRVTGVGPVAIDAIRYRVSVADPTVLLAERPALPTLEANLGWLLARVSGDSPESQLMRVLDLVASTCSDTPHPSTAEHQPRRFDLASPSVDVNAECVALLADGHYYSALRDLMQQATTAIDVCLFHIAMPSDDHPTRDLLDALIQAHGSGRVVRVLMDADEPDDPYLSTVINAPARDYLQAAGVPVKFDQPDRLMHSKFVLIDRTWTVLGSHNWSAGSYFQFDDLSVAVKSPEFAARVTTRFDALWAAAG
jgi:DNA uptake protein ComE-like DNA-binding protein